MTTNGAIEFAQYLMPNGRKKLIEITRPDKIVKMANTVKTLGGLFEVEVLSTSEVSLTVLYDDEDIAIEVVPNGPGMAEAVDRLVASALEHLSCAAGRPEVE